MESQFCEIPVTSSFKDSLEKLAALEILLKLL